MRTVSEHAVIARVNRVLAKDGIAMKKARERRVTKLGQFYTVDIQNNFILEKDADLEAKARELGVLARLEAVAA